MRSVDAPCYCRRSGLVFLCVCVLVTTVSPAKPDEPIEMSFGEADSRRLKEPMGVQINATWRIQWIDVCGNGDAVCRWHYFSDLFIADGVSGINQGVERGAGEISAGT